jgi:hypothetical protein
MIITTSLMDTLMRMWLAVGLISGGLAAALYITYRWS